MKKKRYVPVTFIPVSNEIYQENFEEIFRKGKDKGCNKEKGPFKKAIKQAGGFKTIYTYNANAKLKDLG